MSSLFRKAVNSYLAKRNKVAIDLVELEKLRSSAADARDEIVREGNLTAHWAGMERLKRRAIPINTVIDVGASDGQAVAALLPTYPKAVYFCIEAEDKHEPRLRKAMEKNKKMQYKIAAAGHARGEINFGGNAGDLYAGKASLDSFNGSRKVEMTTLDSEIAERNLPPPFLIKLDTHGFEISVLTGAVKALEQTEILIIEAYNIRFGQDVPLFDELCAFLRGKGFACGDFMEPKYRPKDLMLWQMDLVFLKNKRPEFSDLSYE